jgi:hypothetical protein
MEVRDAVIAVIHVDRDPVKLRDLWHSASPDHVVTRAACLPVSRRTLIYLEPRNTVNTAPGAV